MIIDIILVVLGLLGITIATISDIKTREVPDWISYGMIISGFALRLMHSLTTLEWSYFFYGLLGFGIMLIIGNLMYLLRQWGGGDTKLLMALGVIFATRPFFLEGTIPFLIVLFINILIAGALYGLIVGAVYAIKKRKMFLPLFKKMNKEKRWKQIKVSTLVVVIIGFIVINWFIPEVQSRILMYWILIVILVYPYLVMFTRVVERVCMIKKIKTTELREGDWVEQDVYKNSKLIYKRKKLGIEKSDIRKLLRAKIQKVVVKEGIPFIPPFLIGTIISIVSAEIMFLV